MTCNSYSGISNLTVDELKKVYDITNCNIIKLPSIISKYNAKILIRICND